MLIFLILAGETHSQYQIGTGKTPSGEGAGLRGDLAGKRQTLAAFHLGTKLGVGCARARTAGGTRGFLDVTFLQGIADTDVHASSPLAR